AITTADTGDSRSRTPRGFRAEQSMTYTLSKRQTQACILLALFAALALALPALAQQQRTNASQPTTAATTRNNNGVKHVTSAPGGGLTFSFQDASIDSVLEERSATAGFIIVRVDKPEGRVTLDARQPVTPEQAVTLLNTVLKD